MTEYVTDHKVTEVNTESSDEKSDDMCDEPCGSTADVYIKTMKQFQTAQYSPVQSADLIVVPPVINVQSYLENLVARIDNFERNVMAELKDISDRLRQLNRGNQ